jgi:hypothetical protein
MIPHIRIKQSFCADLLATAGHIPIPYVMGYETFINHARKENS